MPISPMFQHALIVCLKWISGVSLPFRPSSSTRSHLTWVTTVLVAARGQRAWIPQWGLKWKEQPMYGWQEANRHRSCKQGLTLLCNSVLSSHHEQHISGPGAAARQSLRPSASPPPPSYPVPQRPALIYNYHMSLAVALKKKGCLLHEGINW